MAHVTPKFAANFKMKGRIMETKKKSSKKMDLLSAVENVVDLLKESHLDADFYKKAAKPLKYISEKQNISIGASIMMSLFIDNSSDNSITISDFAKHIDCSMTKIIRFMNDIEVLEQRGMIACSRSGRSISYRVPMETIDAFRRDEAFVPRKISGLSIFDLFGMFDEIFEMRDDGELSYDLTKQRIMTLLENNNHLIFVQKLKSFNFDERDEVLLVLFSHLFVNKNDDNIGSHDLVFLYERSYEKSLLKSRLSSGMHILQETKMIEFNNEDGFVNGDSYRMTWMAKQVLFPELNLASMNQNKSGGNLIKHQEITEKQLFYDNDVTSQVENLRQLLEEQHYNEICKRLKDQGYRSGFTCLFYGAPGTGKTETVLQLARQTGRDIMQVNIPEIKSMWVGESEKNIKHLFDNYRMKAEKMDVTPILLFNEADAIIGKRQEGAERAVDKMENSIQNIILQEMETLNGIMIATTNLAQNMDKAFERRFLYKIKFNKPSLEARMSIWHEMLPSLSDSDIAALAKKYDFSGGQIENIARHYAIDGILHGENSISLETLMSHCNNERLGQREIGKIGFRK